MSEHETIPDRDPDDGPERPASASSIAHPPGDQSPRRPKPDRRPRRAGRWAGNLVTGAVVLAAVGIGVAVGMWLAPGTETEGGATASTTAEAGAATVWTCSMHPQIRQPKPGDCPLCGMDLIPASDDGSAEAEGLREVSISREARALLDIRVSPVERRYVTANVRMVGKVDYDETRLGDITARVPGRLDRLYVDYTGVEVLPGDHMVSIYSPELYSAQDELIRARQATQQRRSSGAGISADRMLESAREKLRLWGLTADQIAEIEGQREPSDHLTIYAPMSGIVIHKAAREGMYVETGTPIYTIADLEQVWVKLDAYESDLPWLRYGQTVDFTTEAHPGEVFHGTVAFIDPVLNPRTRTVKVRVNVPNPEGRLKPEMFVRALVRAEVATAGRVMDESLMDKWICRMHPSELKEFKGDCGICGMPLVKTETLGYVSATAAADASAEPLVVPTSAVLKTGARAVVYVERSDRDRPTYEGREIVLGPRAGDHYIVRSGLEEGERVVTQGNFKVDSALQIAAKPSMMNPEAGLDQMASTAIADAAEHPDAPPSFAMQLDRVRSAASTLTDGTIPGDPEATRAALGRFEDALADVDAKGLDGRAAATWKELTMRLRNDAVEGRWAATPEAMASALDRLNADLGRLRRRFGLAETSSVVIASESVKVPSEFRDDLGLLWNSYGIARDALVDDDPEGAHAAAIEAKDALAEFDASALEGHAEAVWSGARDALNDALTEMQEADDLVALRDAFETWSAALSPVVASFGPPEPTETVYRHECSMAFGNRGASWLQSGKEARNPYMGQRMPRCTTGVEVIASADRSGTAEGGTDRE